MSAPKIIHKSAGEAVKEESSPGSLELLHPPPPPPANHVLKLFTTIFL